MLIYPIIPILQKKEGYMNIWTYFIYNYICLHMFICIYIFLYEKFFPENIIIELIFCVLLDLFPDKVRS